MQSHLTRGVFRALLNNEPLRFSHCRNKILHSICSPGTRRVCLNSHGHGHVQRRGIYAFPMPPTPDPPRAIAMEVGLEPMSDLVRSLQNRTRPPPYDVLTKAFGGFFKSRVNVPGVITNFHGRLLIVTWNYLKEHQEKLGPEELEAVFSQESLQTILGVLAEALCLPRSYESVQRVARCALIELSAGPEPVPAKITLCALSSYIRILASSGNPEEALQLTMESASELHKHKLSPWLFVMKGLAMNGNKQKLTKAIKYLDKAKNKFDLESQKELMMTLLQQNLITAAKTMYECLISARCSPTIATTTAVIKASIIQSDLAWAENVINILPPTPNEHTRDCYLLWEAARGGTASTITERLERWSAEDPQISQSLSIACVNDLIEFANALENPQLATDFAALAPKWGFAPDLRTLTLQLESRIQASDVTGTLAYLRELEGDGSVNAIGLTLMNKLITMLCLSEQTDALFDQISTLLEPLIEKNVRLEPDTISALTLMLLQHHDLDSVSQLLRPRLGAYDDDERLQIRKSFISFIKDKSQTDDNVWEAYNLLKVAFPEIGVSSRTDIMDAFFQRNRSDLACLVFGHMRQAESFVQRPKPDTYARCFKGIAKAADRENLELVHNMLKLDLEIELDTRVRNALMLAYAACDLPEQAMDVFKEVLRSEEGPSPKTIIIFFRVCETHPIGVSEATKMMQKVIVLDIYVERKMYTAYIRALAAQGEFERAAEAIDRMQAEIGCRPTSGTIAHFYNASPHQHSKDQVEAWARKKHPELWAYLEALPRNEHEDGWRFGIQETDIHW